MYLRLSTQNLSRLNDNYKINNSNEFKQTNISEEYQEGKMAFLVSLDIFEPRHDKTNKMTVHPANTQISLGICPVWSESSLCTQWVAKDPSVLQVDSKDSDQTGWMPRLIFLRWTHSHFVGFVMSLLNYVWTGRAPENKTIAPYDHFESH